MFKLISENLGSLFQNLIHEFNWKETYVLF